MLLASRKHNRKKTPSRALAASATPPNCRRSCRCGTHAFLVILAAVSITCHLFIHVFAVQLSEVVGASKLEARRAATLRAGAGVGGPPRLRRRGAAGLSQPATSPAVPAAAGCNRSLDVLLVHEHHLKAIGSDMRLLGLLLQLREQGHRVSLLFRGKVGQAERSPPTRELYRIIDGMGLDDPILLTSGESIPGAPAGPPRCIIHSRCW
jgi:hypothetical protein